MTAQLGKMLFASDIARMQKVDIETAQRWLRKWEVQHGPSIVGRVGRRRYTTIEAMEQVGPAQNRATDLLGGKVKDLSERVGNIENILRRDGHVIAKS